MNYQELLQYVHSYEKKHSFPTVDAVVMPPFVMSKDEKTNYTVLSIFRFAPWIRRIHIVVPKSMHEEYKHTTNLVDYWKTHSNQKIVHTCQDLLEYSLASPFLAKQFIVVKPSYIFSNYVFNWQFFINDSPVLRTCVTGIIPLTRDILNECVYQKLTEKNYFKYALTKGLQDKTVRFYNNKDHFIGSCSSLPLKNTQKLVVYDEKNVRQMLRFTVKNKERSKPYKIVVCIINEYIHNLKFTLPTEYENKIQMWVYLGQPDKHSQRLSFLSRVMVTNNFFLEIDPTTHNYNSESIGAFVMKHLRSTVTNVEDLTVKQIFSYGLQSNSSTQMCNEVGNKLAKTYECPYNVFVQSKWDENHMNEFKKLQYL